MNLIVNVTKNWGIGYKNRLLVSISQDLRRFRGLTEGKTVILGRKTLETFPGGLPLKNRNNIILSSNPDFRVEGARVVHNRGELKQALKDVPADDIWVIGGASIYEELLPYCCRACVTMTDTELPADRFFPNLDKHPEWVLESESPVMTEKNLSFRYLDYLNKNPKEL